MPLPSQLLEQLDDRRQRHELGIMLDDLLRRLRDLDSTTYNNYVTLIGSLHDPVTEGPGIDVIAQVVGLGGDTVLTYHANGNPASEEPATAAGLINALANAAAGDTIILPSMTIDLTQSITVPDGVLVTGLTWQAHLSFSGFSGSAIYLHDGATLYRLRVTYTATGSEAIGVNLMEDGATVDEVMIVVSGATHSNIGIGSEPVDARELWFATCRQDTYHSVDAIVWTNSINFKTADDITWYTMQGLPADSSYCQAFIILRDGSELFYAALDTAHSNRYTIWRCTNLADVRAAPETIPTWTVIYYTGMTISTNLVDYTATDTTPIVLRYDNALCAAINIGSTAIYGEYSTGSWSWHARASAEYEGIAPGAAYRQVWGGPSARDVELDDAMSDLFIGTTSIGVSSYGISTYVWRSTYDNTYYAARRGFIGEPYDEPDQEYPRVFRFTGLTGTAVLTTLSDAPEPNGHLTARRYAIRGALDGPAINLVQDTTGKLYLSENRSGMAHVATWKDGICLESRLAGGGALVWLAFDRGEDLAFIRTSTNRGATWHDRGGNYNSDIKPTGASYLIDAHTVFV